MARPPTSQTTRRLLASGGAEIAKRLPPRWQLSVEARAPDRSVVRITAPDGRTADVRVLVRRRLDPRAVDAIAPTDGPVIVFADWLSPRVKTILSAAGLGYADATGNVLVRVDEPGLSITADGATRDPSPRDKRSVNLRGPRAWALQRTLAEVLPPYSLGSLSEALGTDAGYLSRLLGGLADELLIDRRPRQPVSSVDWEGMIRQVARSYSLLDDNETTSWIAAAGPEQFLSDLASSKLRRWAVTGSFASSRIVSIAAPTMAVVYTDDPERLAETLRLLPTRTGGNVVTALPYDPIVFERTWTRDGIAFASVAQVTIDCLTGFGRMPQEGDALIEWMRKQAPKWQARGLEEVAALP